jgi:hypothetical protein
MYVPRTENISCAGEAAIIARPPTDAIASLRRFVRVARNGGRHRGCSATATSGPRCCGCLRTRAPGTKPTILGITGGILEALISILHRPSMEALSLGCSHEGSESGQSRYRHHKLAHCSLLLRFYGDATTLGCIKVTLTSYCYDMLVSIVQILMACSTKAHRIATGPGPSDRLFVQAPGRSLAAGGANSPSTPLGRTSLKGPAECLYEDATACYRRRR